MCARVLLGELKDLHSHLHPVLGARFLTCGSLLNLLAQLTGSHVGDYNHTIKWRVPTEIAHQSTPYLHRSEVTRGK